MRMCQWTQVVVLSGGWSSKWNGSSASDWLFSNSIKKAECKLALRQKSKAIDLCRRLAALRLCFGLGPLISFRSKFLCHGLLEFLSIYSVAFGGVHENVVAAGGGSLIRRIQKADFQKAACRVRPRRIW